MGILRLGVVMKSLSKLQKQILNRYFEDYLGWDQLPKDIQDKLYAIRDYETLEQDVNRYMNDSQLELRYGNK